MRVHYVLGYRLNPDEAIHFSIANQETLGRAYESSLVQAHPPLLTVVLYLVLRIGHSEALLRLPSLICGTAAVWLAFLWLRRQLGDVAALCGLVFLTCSPSAISAASEVRQYGLLLFFTAAALLSHESLLREGTPRAAILHGLSLCGALVSHYSAVWFVLALAVHGCVHVARGSPPASLVRAWAATQVAATAVLGALYFTHLVRLHGGSVESAAIAGYLRSGYFSPADSPVAFACIAMFNAFGYLSGDARLGAALLLAWLAGMVILGRPRSTSKRRDLALLLALPFAFGLAGALVRVLPFGGSRHVSGLLPFVAAGLGAAGAAAFGKRIAWVSTASPLVAAVALHAATPENRIRNVPLEPMTKALAAVRQLVPPGSFLFVDDETRNTLNYYLGRGRPLPEADWLGESGYLTELGSYRVVSSRSWRFDADSVVAVTRGLFASLPEPPAPPVWVMAVRWNGGRSLFPGGSQSVVRQRQFGDITLAEIRLQP